MSLICAPAKSCVHDQKVNGSYVIDGFVSRAKQQLSKKDRVGPIGELFKDVQEDLGDRKQLPVFQWCNDVKHVIMLKKRIAEPLDGEYDKEWMEIGSVSPMSVASDSASPMSS